MSITKNLPLKWYSSMKKQIRKFGIIFDVENWLWKSEISTFGQLISEFWQEIWNWLNSSFFWNWCNVNPDKIMKWDQLWFRRFVSIILNPFSRVFAISAFLKVIHAPKTPNFRYPKNNLPTYIFSNLCNGDFL